jgi:3-hydroxy-9,10-secoandrosta-1,3,5(10)-triene-9,17-dione monooxygenase reductase component
MSNGGSHPGRAEGSPRGISVHMSSSPSVRDAFAQFTSGVTLVTAHDGRRPYGMTVSAFSAVSVAPPLLLICVGARSKTLEVIKDAGRFAVCVLAEEHRDLAEGFAGKASDRWTPFETYAWYITRGGSPVLVDSLAWFGCGVSKCYTEGDHMILIGSIDELNSRSRAKPLLYGNRAWSTTAPWSEIVERAAGKQSEVEVRGTDGHPRMS